jgi:hypothetical protein
MPRAHIGTSFDVPFLYARDIAELAIYIDRPRLRYPMTNSGLHLTLSYSPVIVDERLRRGSPTKPTRLYTVILPEHAHEND